MSDHPIGPDGMPFVTPRFLYEFSTPRPCILRDDATGVEITGQGRPVVDTKVDQRFVEFTATWDALPETTKATLIEKYGKRKARHDWANVLINAPVEQVHWIEDDYDPTPDQWAADLEQESDTQILAAALLALFQALIPSDTLEQPEFRVVVERVGKIARGKRRE